MITRAEIMALLQSALRRPGPAVRRIQTLAWDTPEDQMEIDGQEREVLRDLAYDLEYVLQGTGSRGEEPSLFGPERVKAEIDAALVRLKAPSGGDKLGRDEPR
jgi:hypothetical protein